MWRQKIVTLVNILDPSIFSWKEEMSLLILKWEDIIRVFWRVDEKGSN